MQNVILSAFLATVCTWFITALGASTVFLFKNTNRKAMNLMLGFSAGVMIAASFWSLLEPAIERAEEYLSVPSWFAAASGFLLGAGFMWLCDRVVRRIGENGRQVKTEISKSTGNAEYIENAEILTDAKKCEISVPKVKAADSLSRSLLLVISITLHNIPEGLAVGVAFGAINQSQNPSEALMAAVGIAMGIGIQNFPEGAAVAVPLRREGMSRKKSFLIGQATALVEPIAGVAGAMLVIRIQTMLPYALSFAAGAMLLVAVHELIPQAQEGRKEGSFASTMGIIAGFAVMMVLDVALG